jgi:hypothetical protein
MRGRKKGRRKKECTRDAAFAVPGVSLLPLAKYAGTYVDEWYGEIAIDEQQGRLGVRFTHTASLTGTLEHWQHDTFIARWSDRELRADNLKPK